MPPSADDHVAPGIWPAAHAVQHALHLAAVAPVDAGLELARQVEALGIDVVHGTTSTGFYGASNALTGSPSIRTNNEHAGRRAVFQSRPRFCCATSPPAASDPRRSDAAAYCRSRGMPTYLDFEKPIAELEGKIEELRHLTDGGDINIAEEV